jgi:hypothetical protein
MDPANTTNDRQPAFERPKDNESTEQREQPWQKLIDEIMADAEKNPLEKDFFPCKDGFEAHSLAA